MRAITGGERTAIAAPAGHSVFAYMEVTNFDGTWIHLGELAYGSRTIDALISAVLTDNIDANTPSLTATFRRNVGNYSLSPFRSDSPWNVDDSGGLYQPLLDLHRQWRLWVAVLARGTFPADPSDYREMARGVVDKIEIAGDPATITVTGRGPEADLIDHWIPTDNPTTYPGDDIGPMLQAILDNELGAGAVTLVLDASAPSFFVEDYTPAGIGLMAALTSIASLPGANLRFRYDASDVLALTLFTPNRTPLSPDWSLDSGAEIEALDASSELNSVSNYIVVRYMDANGQIQTVTSPATPSSASITRYGLRTLEIDLSSSTAVRTSTAAQALADAVAADRQFPLLDQQATAAGIWFGELWDYAGIGANGIHFDQDQAGGVVTVEQRFENGDLTSSFGLSGAPKGRYVTWLTFGGPAASPQVPTLTSLDATFSEVVFLLTIPILQWSAVAGPYTNSVFVEYSDDPAFGTTIATSNHAATPGDPVTGGTLLPTTADRDITYYVRATAYSGPIVSSAVSGTVGEQYVANTYAHPKISDSPTVSVNRSVAGALSFDVDPSTATDPTALAAGAGVIHLPFFDYGYPIVEKLKTIPSSAAEIHARLRRAALLAGMGTARLVANVRSITTGTEVLRCYYSTDGGATWTAISGGDLPLSYQTGVVRGPWFAVPNAMQGDVDITLYVLGGDGTQSARLSSAALQASPTVRSGGGTPAPVGGGGGGGGDVTAGLFWWMDAQNMGSFSDGAPVPTWPDQSGNGNHATADTATSAWQPHYAASAINGHPAVLFSVAHSGNDRGFSLPGGFNPTEAHLFIVLKPLVASPAYSLGPQTSGNNPEMPATLDGSGHIYDHFGTTVRHDFAAGIDTTGGFIYHSHAKAGLWEAHVNGALAFTTATNTTQFGGQKLGTFLFGGAFVVMFQGYIGEFRVYSGARSSTDVDDITDFLATKWGITL